MQKYIVVGTNAFEVKWRKTTEHMVRLHPWCNIHNGQDYKYVRLGWLWLSWERLCSECLGSGETEDGQGCPECCEHEFDWSEGYSCLNCGEQGDVGFAIDCAEWAYGPER